VNRPAMVSVAVAGAAAGAALVWLVSLSGRVGLLETVGSPDPAVAVASEGELRRTVARLEARVEELSAEVRRLRESAGASGASSPSGTAPVPPGNLEEAVAEVLRRREAEERRARFRTAADRIVMRLDPEVRLPADTLRALPPILAEWLDERDAVLRNPRGLSVTERDAALDTLASRRDGLLAALLTPEDLAAVRRRLDPAAGRTDPAGFEGPERGRGEGVDRLPPLEKEE